MITISRPADDSREVRTSRALTRLPDQPAEPIAELLFWNGSGFATELGSAESRFCNFMSLNIRKVVSDSPTELDERYAPGLCSGCSAEFHRNLP